MRQRRTPYTVGVKEAAWIEILAHVQQPHAEAPSYHVRCLNCGSESIMTFETIRSRVSKRHRHCIHCINKGHRRLVWPVGWLPEAHLEILGEAKTDERGMRHYHVRWPCCGGTWAMSVSAIRKRIENGSRHCLACRHKTHKKDESGISPHGPQDPPATWVGNTSHATLFRPCAQIPDLPALPASQDPARAWPRPPVRAAQSTTPWVQEALWGTP